MIEILQVFLSPGAWLALITLVLLEMVLGIDNIVFLSIMTGKLPAEQQSVGRRVGLLLAMVARIGLLFSISLLVRLTKPLFSMEFEWLSLTVTGQSIIILLGGLFLLYKSVSEIHDKIEGNEEEATVKSRRNSFGWIIFQIVLLDIVFSLDSVFTAVGMVSFDDFGYGGGMFIMSTAIVLTVTVMLFFSGPVSRFVNNHPSIQMLALAFLILIAVTLIIESGELAHMTIFHREIKEVPKGYIYFAIAFSLLVETLNLRHRKTMEQRAAAAEEPEA
jgi:predicted tellurium resistance membrane protein TerC